MGLRVAATSSAARRFERIEPESPPPPSITDGIPRNRPLRVGIISNPLSGQNARRGLHIHIREVLRSHPRVAHFDADTLEGMTAAARELMERETEILVVNGGDGTAQVVLTTLMGTATGRLPLLAILAGGTTNTTARNVGYGRKPLPALQRLLTEAASGTVAGAVQARPVVRADFGDQTQHAMMFGAGAVYHGILFARRHIEARGVRGEFGAGLAVATFIGKVLSGSGGTLFPPVHADVCIDGNPLPKQSYLGILTSTVSRQILGITPYWGEGPGPLRCSLLRYRPRHLARAVVPVLRGRAGVYVRPEFGYRSVNAHDVRMEFDSGFTLDGQLFPPGFESTVVTLSARQRAYFLRDAR